MDCGQSAARFAESSSQRPKCGRSLSSTRSANVSPSTTTLTPLNMRGSMGHIVLEPANKGFGTYGGGGGWGGVGWGSNNKNQSWERIVCLF